MDDLAVPQHHRSGAHRARRHPLLTVLVSLAAVAVFSGVLLWALLSLDVLGAGERLEGGLAGPAASPAATAPEDGPTAEPSAGPTAGPTAEPTAEPAPTAEVSPDATGEPLPSAEPTPEAVVDRTVGVDVLNSTSTVGLAAGAAEELSGSGWAVGEVGNYGAGEIPTTVLYPAEDLRATAEALAADLGLGEVEASDDVDVVTLVLGADYPG